MTAVTAAPENKTRPISTGWPALDLELALAGPATQELALAALELARRLRIPLEGRLEALPELLGAAEDRQRCRTWTIGFRALSGATQAQLPTLQDLLARVAFAVGEFQNAQRDFMALAKTQPEMEAQALARYHAFLSALERPHFSDASVELRHAVALGPRQFSPVPLDRFDPEQIFAADCLGITLRCKTRGGIGQGDYVSLRTIHPQFLNRPIPAIFEDQKKLSAARHRALLPVMGTGYAAEGHQRPFFTFAYYEGTPLDQYVQRSGVIAPKDFVPLFLSWVEALSTAHEAGVWHRALRPEYIMVRRKVSGFSGVVTNFGLEMRPEFYQWNIDNPTALGQTTFGRTLANSLDYAAPEQLSRQPEPISPATDVYSLAKVACLALFGTPHPALNHWRQAGEGLAQILHECIRENPAQRPTLAQLKARLEPLVDPELANLKPGSIDPQFAALVASYQPPPGVGMATVPVIPAGMPVRRRLSAKEILWQWRFQMLKWGSAIVLTLMVAAVVIAIFWPTGRTVKKVEPVPVRGKLVLRLQSGDKPIPNARLIFIPDLGDGKRATAETDDKGEFELKTEFPGDGALPGRYRVLVEKDPSYDRARIMPNVAETDRNFRDYLGGQLGNLETDVHRNYSDERRSRLRITVPPEGTTNLCIPLNVLGQ